MVGRIKQLVKKALGITPLNPETQINKNNQGIINLVDIGSVGLLPEPWLQNAEIIRRLLKFEPRDVPSQNENIISISAALWDSNAELPFYIYKGFNHTGSSLYRQNYQYVKDNFDTLKKRGEPYLAETWFDRSSLVREEKLYCRRLDDVLQEKGLDNDYHFIKVDAQGAEYPILRGAESILQQHCLGLHLELFTIPLYEGIKLLPEVETYLKQFGFELVKRFPAHGSFDSQHDCLFLKTSAKDKTALQTIKRIYKIQ
jgi:FkbM family methyltransferase